MKPASRGKLSRPAALPVLLSLAAATVAYGGEAIQFVDLKWDVHITADWKVTHESGGPPTLELLVPRPSTQPRRPVQYALARTAPYRRLELEVEMKQEPEAVRKRRNSLILVYAWRGPDHFNYAHISVDTAKQQPVHNGIFHVYGGDRVRISSDEGRPALLNEDWHKVRLVYDAGTGRADVWVDGKTSPSFAGGGPQFIGGTLWYWKLLRYGIVPQCEVSRRACKIRLPPAFASRQKGIDSIQS